LLPQFKHLIKTAATKTTGRRRKQETSEKEVQEKRYNKELDALAFVLCGYN
jgi:hypothetical protein